MADKTRRDIIKAGLGGMLAVFIPKGLTAEESPDWFEHYWVYIIDINACIGCGACVRADKRENDVPPAFFRTWVERYQVTEDDHVYVDSPNGGKNGFVSVDNPAKDAKPTKGFFVPKLCNHCRHTPCAQVCPVNASYISPQGVVLVDKQRCIGCGYCVQACPYGSRYIDPRTHTADKCTWCFHRITKGLQPACVTVCPTGARKFGDLKEKGSEIRKILSTALTNVLKPELNTEPFCFYIGIDKAVR